MSRLIKILEWVDRWDIAYYGIQVIWIVLLGVIGLSEHEYKWLGALLVINLMRLEELGNKIDKLKKQ